MSTLVANAFWSIVALGGSPTLRPSRGLFLFMGDCDALATGTLISRALKRRNRIRGTRPHSGDVFAVPGKRVRPKIGCQGLRPWLILFV
jgi:hypothetical protein